MKFEHYMTVASGTLFMVISASDIIEDWKGDQSYNIVHSKHKGIHCCV